MNSSPLLSFEFFPPKTDQGKVNLATTRKELGKFSPEFFSVTYGAGGSTRGGAGTCGRRCGPSCAPCCGRDGVATS